MYLFSILKDMKPEFNKIAFGNVSLVYHEKTPRGIGDSEQLRINNT